MTRVGQAAIDYARSRVGGSMPDDGLCLQFVRTCFDVGSYYYSAIDAWNGSPTKHPGDRNPPPGVPLYFATPSQYDHVVFCCSPSEIVTTWGAAIRSYGGDAISAIERDFDGTYLGWCEDINRVTIWTGDDDDMPSIEEIRSAVADETAKVMRGPEFNLGVGSLDPRIAAATWGQVLSGVNPYNGTNWAAPAGSFLMDARADSQPAYVAQTVWATEPPDSTVTSTRGSRDLLVFALVILIAVVGGVAVGLLANTTQGAIAGGAAIIGGLLATVLRNLPRSAP